VKFLIRSAGSVVTKVSGSAETLDTLLPRRRKTAGALSGPSIGVDGDTFGEVKSGTTLDVGRDPDVFVGNAFENMRWRRVNKFRASNVIRDSRIHSILDYELV